MPILYHPPYHRLYESTPCPETCLVPAMDSDAYTLNPQYRWVYNKLTIAELQGIKCGPHKTTPSIPFPIFSKPIYNLGGLGAAAQPLTSREEYLRSLTPGHMWSELLTGEHYSTDIAVAAGKPVWFSHTRGKPGPGQTWDYWEVNVPNAALTATLSSFVRKYLAGYVGMLNVETIGGKIIEVHLRFTQQWPDLYGEWFLPAVVDLYSGKGWTGPSVDEDSEDVVTTGYSVVLFDDRKYALVGATIEEDFLVQIERELGVTSVVRTYDPDMPLEAFAMPIGGFRLITINGFDLERCKLARERFRGHLRELFVFKSI